MPELIGQGSYGSIVHLTSPEDYRLFGYHDAYEEGKKHVVKVFLANDALTATTKCETEMAVYNLIRERINGLKDPVAFTKMIDDRYRKYVDPEYEVEEVEQSEQAAKDDLLAQYMFPLNQECNTVSTEALMQLGYHNATNIYAASFLMPMCDKITQWDKLSRVDFLTCMQVVRYSVMTLHALGIVHGDIKPDNMLICGENVHIIDFGVSMDIGMNGDLLSQDFLIRECQAYFDEKEQKEDAEFIEMCESVLGINLPDKSTEIQKRPNINLQPTDEKRSSTGTLGFMAPRLTTLARVPSLAFRIGMQMGPGGIAEMAPLVLSYLHHYQILPEKENLEKMEEFKTRIKDLSRTNTLPYMDLYAIVITTFYFMHKKYDENRKLVFTENMYGVSFQNLLKGLADEMKSYFLDTSKTIYEEMDDIDKLTENLFPTENQGGSHALSSNSWVTVVLGMGVVIASAFLQ